MGGGAGKFRRYVAGPDVSEQRGATGTPLLVAAHTPAISSETVPDSHPAPHLHNLPTRSLLKLARQEDALAARQCLERRELEDLLITRLGAEKANRKGYHERPDVREAQVLSTMLGRMVCEVRSLQGAVQERHEFLQACIDIELASEHPSPEECSKLNAALADAGDSSVAVQTILEDVEEQAASLAERVADGYDASPGSRLEPVNELAERALKMLGMLAPAAEALGDKRQNARLPSVAEEDAAGTQRSQQGKSSAKPSESSNARAAALQEISEILKSQHVAAGGSSGEEATKDDKQRRERERIKLVTKRERLIEKADLREEREVLEEEHESLWAELDELEKERDKADNGFEVMSPEERAFLQKENADLADELEQQLAAMNRVLDLLEEERETQVSQMRQKKMKIDLEDCDDEASVSMTWTVDADGNVHNQRSGFHMSTEGDVTYGERQYKLSPEDIDFDAGSKIGSGAGGVVSRGILKKTGELVAVKTIRIDSDDKRDQLLSEIKGLVQAEGCTSLVQWYAGFASKVSASVHVVLEFMDLGSLADMKARLNGKGVPASKLSCAAQQIMEGIDFLHKKRLLHRDIKPPNILHNRKGEVKLTDFGLSRSMNNASLTAGTFVGTSTYMSPERCLGEDYGFASDIWSIGMVLFELATGRYPFGECKSFLALFDHLCEKPEPRLKVGQFPPELCDIVASCLTRDVSQRAASSALLQHDYVSKDVCAREEFSAWLASLV
mmetsp:Transcript_115232/g.298774  ORF Transcript_115232/g.298774 Transcript_115232/m.298774 type:complete len:733 (-) Transcript_115232:42-2240(-)